MEEEPQPIELEVYTRRDWLRVAQLKSRAEHLMYQSTHTHFHLSDCNPRNKFTLDARYCLLPILAGRGDNIEVSNIGHLSNLMVEPGGRKLLRRDLGGVLSVFRDSTDTYTRAVGLLGGFVAKRGEGDTTGDIALYLCMLEMIQEEVDTKLGLELQVLAPPRRTRRGRIPGSTELYYQTSERTGIVDLDPPEEEWSPTPFLASEAKIVSEKW